MILIPIIVFIILLSFIVFIHELGHFATAKKFGVKVEEFGIGLPPKAWGKKFKDTIYSINWLPIGGFVRLKGEDFENYNPKDKTNFINKKPWQKAIILIAGIFMNTVLAITIFYFTLGLNGWQSNPILLINGYNFKYGNVVNIPNVITFIQQDGPAYNSDIKFGDQILKVEYLNESVVPISSDEFKNFIKDKEGKEILIYTENINTKEKTKYIVTPEYNIDANQPAIGVGLSNAIKLSYKSFGNKLFAGFLHSINLTNYSFDILGSLIKTSFKTKDVSPVAEGVSGPVGVFGAVKAVLESGSSMMVFALLELSALLSLSLAVMNLLPIPALDGGRLVFVMYEWISGKKPSRKLESKAVQLGFMLLMALIVLITIKDILSFF